MSAPRAAEHTDWEQARAALDSIHQQAQLLAGSNVEYFNRIGELIASTAAAAYAMTDTAGVRIDS